MIRLIVVAILVALVILIILEFLKPKVVRKEEDKLEKLEVEEAAMDVRERAVQKEKALDDRRRRLEQTEGGAPEK